MSNTEVPSDFFEITVIWEDQTRYGSTLSGRAQETVRRQLYPRAAEMLIAQMERPAVERKPFPARELAELVQSERRGSAHHTIIENAAFWHPDAQQVCPKSAIIRASCSTGVLDLPLTADAIAALRHAMLTGETQIAGLSVLLGEATRTIAEVGFQRAQLGIDRFPMVPVFVGHACVTWTDGDLRLWSDPFFRPKNLRFPLHYQPIAPCDVLETRHAILITHSHPDHFAPGSLLMFPADTPILVPKVTREDLLSLDLVYRLGQLGFTNVKHLAWGETAHLGTFEVTAVPFHGEQPLGSGARPDRSERMLGNGYRVASARGLSALILADSGADAWAGAAEAARRIRDICGQTDIVFANHRRWRIYPPQYLTTSVPEFLCFVPDSELAIPQQIMYSPEDLWSVAETLGARHVIPYAMGGAAWFEEIGLGVDNLNPHRGSAFEGGPLDLANFADPDTLAAPGFVFENALPGQGIGPDGALHWPKGMRLPTHHEMTAQAPIVTAPIRTLALGGRLLSQELIRDLFELARLDPNAWFVAMPGYCELVASGNEASEFLWSMVSRLSLDGLWRFMGDRPLSAGLFRSRSDWCDAFERFQRNAFLALRDVEQPFERIRDIVHDISEQEAPTEVITAICKELLDIELDARLLARRHMPSSTSTVFSKISSEPALPPQADPLVRQWDKSAVARSLIVVKVLHNTFITAQLAERKSLPPDEATFWARVL
jgi:L-ascorbate metabolism protein UlaG (beta-lactamase superfamily)